MFIKLIRIYTYVRINHTPIYKIAIELKTKLHKNL